MLFRRQDGHQYRFDAGSGALLWPPDKFYRLACYPVNEEQGLVKAKVGW